MRYAILLSLSLTLIACLSVKVAQGDPPRTPSMKCIGGGLTAQPKFSQASPGRAEYHFSGVCTTRQGQDFGYRLSATWTPSEANPSNANASEIYRIDALSGPSQSFEVIIGARCANDPWLNDAACTRVGDNVPDDLRALWPELTEVLFPQSRRGIPYDQRDALRAEYTRANGGFDRLQRLTDTTHLDDGAKVGTIAANRRSGSINQRIDEVALNPQPLPPGPGDFDPAQPAAGVAARGAQAGIIIVSGKTPDRLDQSAKRKSRSAVDATTGRAARVSLNPQPLPPGPADSEMDMINVQEYVSQQSQVTNEAANMTKALNDAAMSAAENIGDEGPRPPFAGRWSTPFGELTLQQTGNAVDGDYP
ncbi:MAG: hypothetical protein ACREP1_03500, partial [Rhodanobacteraceae bacterium]